MGISADSTSNCMLLRDQGSLLSDMLIPHTFPLSFSTKASPILKPSRAVTGRGISTVQLGGAGSLIGVRWPSRRSSGILKFIASPKNWEGGGDHERITPGPVP